MLSKKKYLFMFVFILVLGCYGVCCYAWTFDDIYDLANNVDTTLLTAEQATTRSYILAYWNEYVEALSNKGYNMDNYHSFQVYYRSNNGIIIYAWGGSTNWSVNNTGRITNGQMVSSTYPNTNNLFSVYYSNNNWVCSTGGNGDNYSNRSIGLYEGASTTFLNTSGLIAQNVYNSIVTTNVNVPSNSSVPYLFTQGVVGLHYDISQVHYKLVLKGASGTQDTFNQDLGAVFSETGNGHSVNLQLTSLSTLHGTNNYYIDMYYGDSIIYTSDTFSISYSGGGSSGGSTSGDTSGSTIDLTDTNNKIDNVANKVEQVAQSISGNTEAIKEQTQAIISGNQAIIGALTDTTPPASGEITIDDLPSIEVEDVSQEFFSWLLVKVKEVLDYNGVSILTIPIYNQNFEIRSDVFSLPNGVLKTFIQAGWYFIVGVPFLKFIRHFIEKIKGGNIPGADEKDDLLGNVL